MLRPLILSALLFFLGGCTTVFYQPSTHVYSNPKDFKLDHEDKTILTKDGIKLHAWHLKSNDRYVDKSLVLFFHGNAQNLTAHYLNMAWLVNKGHELLVFDYRGYGRSEGRPTPHGTYLDALAALRFAYDHFKKMKYKRFIVHAQSLGGIIALRALQDFEYRDKIDLLVLDSTFSSYVDVAFDKLKSSWLTYILSPLAFVLVSDEMAPDMDKVSKFKIPILVVHSKSDPVIPFKFGEIIYNKLESTKWFWRVDNSPHIGIFHVEKGFYQEKLLSLIKDL